MLWNCVLQVYANNVICLYGLNHHTLHTCVCFYRLSCWCNVQAVHTVPLVAQQCNKPKCLWKKKMKYLEEKESKILNTPLKKSVRFKNRWETGSLKGKKKFWRFQADGPDQVQIQAWLLAPGLDRVPVDPEFLEGDQKTWPEGQSWSAAIRQKEKLPLDGRGCKPDRKKEENWEAWSMTQMMMFFFPTFFVIKLSTAPNNANYNVNSIEMTHCATQKRH